MAADPPPSGYGYYSRTFKSDSGGKAMTNTWGFQNTSGGVASVVVGAIRTASTSAGSIYDPAQYTDQYDAIGDYCLVNNAGILSSVAAVFTIPGTAVWNPVNPAVSAVIRKNTNFAGRQYRGRVALPAAFLDEDVVDENGDLSGRQTTIATAANLFRTNASTAGVPLVLLHQPWGVPLPVNPAPAPTPIVSCSCDQYAGTQRKRQMRS